MFLFHTSSFQAKERAAESMLREMLGRIFSLHVKAESRESFSENQTKMAGKHLKQQWTACVHLFITFTRI